MASNHLARDTFKRILKQHAHHRDLSKIPKPQQTVLLVYQSYGLIGNGGFQYLFEGDFPGDPEFLLTHRPTRPFAQPALPPRSRRPLRYSRIPPRPQTLIVALKCGNHDTI